VHLPAGRTYKMSAVVLADVEDLELRIDGTIRAPPMDRWPARAEPEDETQSPELRRMRYAFLELRRAKRVTVTGSGAVEGSGRAWWRVRKRRPSVRAPVLLLIADSRDVAVTHLRLAESPFYHVVVLRSSSVALRRLRVASPPGSVNTDGIDLLAARDVTVDDCWVDTGDDNVAIKEGCVGVEVRGGTFYKGHGLSIGSLGEGGTTASVRDVVLSGVRFVKTSNAARVKTWQGGSGAVANVTFRDLDVRAVGAPVVVDQFYCPASQHPGPCANESKAVAVERVTIDGVTGWHTSGVAAMLHCSDAAPCDVSVSNLKLEGAPGCSNVVRCWNVKAGPGPCAAGNAMHGFRFDLSRKERRALAVNATCVHPD